MVDKASHGSCAGIEDHLGINLQKVRVPFFQIAMTSLKRPKSHNLAGEVRCDLFRRKVPGCADSLATVEGGEYF
jgi:hypothetical protein